MRLCKVLLVLASASLAGCQMLPITFGAKPEPPVKKTAPIAGEAVLYARDGSIVTPADGSGAGGLPRREVQGGDGSRTKMLELYQRVVEERDHLQLSLADRDSELVLLRKQIEEERAHSVEVEARMKTAETASAELANQNLELAGRLTVAQIRRLEAEKKWLELSIALPAKTVAAVENAQTPVGRDKALPASQPSAPTPKPVEKTPVKHEQP